MLQRFITADGKMLVLDAAPDEFSRPWMPNIQGTFMAMNRRWQESDGAPVLVLMDYQNGVLAVENDPERYRPAAMPDDEHAALVAAFKARKAA